MKEIKLSQNKIALVDDDMFEYLNQWKWFAQKGYNTFYAGRNGTRKTGKRIRVDMHRLILGLNNGDGKLIDHMDGDGLNNQKSNLRVCSKGENNRNCQKHKNSTSNYKGVFLKKQIRFKKGTQRNVCYEYWCSSININNNKRHLGTFKTEKEAALAYNKAAIKYHGEFANLNQI